MKETIRGLRWWIIAVVMIGTSLNYLTRSTLGVAAPTVLADLNIGEREYGWITAAFQLGIMLQPVAGYVLDLIGLRIGLAAFAAAWATITMAHGLATSWQSLLLLRGALGIAEGTAHPGGLKVVSEWFPARERGFAGGIYNVGASMGSMIAPPLVAGRFCYGTGGPHSSSSDSWPRRGWCCG
jgi:ACS family hexuronate transporter-like MFS transporter